MEVKVSRDTKVVIGLTEAEAARLMSILNQTVDFASEPLALEIFESLAANDIVEDAATYSYEEDLDLCVRDEA